MCSLLVQASVASTQLKVLSLVPLIVRPAPSAVTSVGVVTLARTMFLSATTTSVLDSVVVVPLTVRLPVMTALPPTLRFPLIWVLSGSPKVKVLVPELVLTSISPAVPWKVTVPPRLLVTLVVVVEPPSGVATPLMVMLLLARALLGMLASATTPVVLL